MVSNDSSSTIPKERRAEMIRYFAKKQNETFLLLVWTDEDRQKFESHEVNIM